MNTAAIVAGGVLGLFSGNILKENYRHSLIQANGVAVVFLGISGALKEMITVVGNKVETGGAMIMILSLVLGVICGEFLHIEERLESFGEWLKQKSGSSKDASFVEAFVTSSLTVCIGAMAIVGAIQDGLLNDPSTLIIKAILDFLIIMVMSASMGKGCIFSAVPVAFLQGGVTVLARFIQPVMTESAVSALSMVGSVLIFCVGVNLLKPKTFRVANMLPGVVFAIILSFVL